MTAPFSPGDLVRVKPELLRYYTAAVRKQVENRKGAVKNCFVPMGRSSGAHSVNVYWLNRRTGAPNAVADCWLSTDLELAP